MNDYRATVVVETDDGPRVYDARCDSKAEGLMWMMGTAKAVSKPGLQVRMNLIDAAKNRIVFQISGNVFWSHV